MTKMYPEWKRTGKCNQCGYCCIANIVLDVRIPLSFIPIDHSTDRLFYNLRGIKIDDDKKEVAFLFRSPCEWIGEEKLPDGTVKYYCKNYKDRPNVCREAPQHPDQVKDAKKCGFKWRNINEDIGNK